MHAQRNGVYQSIHLTSKGFLLSYRRIWSKGNGHLQPEQNIDLRSRAEIEVLPSMRMQDKVSIPRHKQCSRIYHVPHIMDNQSDASS